MKHIVSTAILVATLTLLVGCATTSNPTTVAADPSILRVGVSPDAPPMIFKQGEQLAGVEVELAQALGRELGRKVVFVELEWEDLLDALDEDKADILMSSVTITTARQFRMSFSNPYLRVGQMALVRSEDKYKYQVNLANSAKRGIGVQRGTTAEQVARQDYSRAKVKYYASGEKAAQAVLDKDIDLFISDFPMIWYLGSRYEAKGLTVAPMVLTDEYLGWAVRRTDSELLQSVNAFLARVQQNGELQAILGRWMPGYR